MADASLKVIDVFVETKKVKLRKLKEMTAPRRMDVRVTDASLQVVDVLEELNQAIMSLRKLKEMTAPRRMDVSMRKVMMMASAVLLVVQLMLNVMENVEAGVADVLMIVKNKEMATRDVKVGGVLTQLMSNVMENVEEEAGMAGALIVMNRLTKMMSGTMREKRTTVI